MSLAEEQAVLHNIPPVYDKNSRILILGSFPSVKSRKGRFFYHHPQNRFWKVMSAVYDAPCPVTVEEKKAFLLSHNIAVWDVVQSCIVTGSSDSSIKNVAANPLEKIISESSITRVFTNGNKAYSLYEKLCRAKTGIGAVLLPSTSPANAAYSTEHLISIWKEKLL